MAGSLLFAIFLAALIWWGIAAIEKSDKKKKEQLADYCIGDKLTVVIRRGEHTSTRNKATIIQKDTENPLFFYCEVIYPEVYEEPLERICYSQIEKNLSLERRINGL